VTVPAPFISFLTDFGNDTAPATCRGVIWSIVPEARINDLTHVSRRFAIRDGAFLLWSSLPYQPIGVHLAVVDPGVGTERRPIALRVGRGDALVGPDNGLLVPAAERLGGIVAAHALTNQALWRQPVSHTFHGRDIFAPVAAHLAAGEPLASVGPAVDPATLMRLSVPEPVVRDGGLDTSVLFIDTFGNCRVAGQPKDLAGLRDRLAPGDTFTLRIGSRVVAARWQTAFGAVALGEPLLYDDADLAGLAIGVNQGSAADAFGLTHDSTLRIEPA
jgi:S-adenosylmethionine hydrolase